MRYCSLPCFILEFSIFLILKTGWVSSLTGSVLVGISSFKGPSFTSLRCDMWKVGMMWQYSVGNMVSNKLMVEFSLVFFNLQILCGDSYSPGLYSVFFPLGLSVNVLLRLVVVAGVPVPIFVYLNHSSTVSEFMMVAFHGISRG